LECLGLNFTCQSGSRLEKEGPVKTLSEKVKLGAGGSHLILATQEDHNSKPAGEIVRETLSQKYPTQKRACGVIQVVAYLPSKCEALSSNPSTTKKQNKTKQKHKLKAKGLGVA
jgi:hypothetical protein